MGAPLEPIGSPQNLPLGMAPLGIPIFESNFAVPSFLLQENGDFILQENGQQIELDG